VRCPASDFARHYDSGTPDARHRTLTVPADSTESLLITAVRRGDQHAWQDLIARYEGRLLAFVDSRLRNRAASEDIVQDTFLGFLVSLPNYDSATPLETYLFSIAAHKLTDVLRRKGRRPTIPLMVEDSQGHWSEPAGNDRRASSLAQSRERRVAEEQIIGECLRSLIASWKENEELERLQCIELLFVLGWPNKSVAERLGISEQAVANHKHFAVTKLKEAAKKARIRNFDPANFGII
jgi:RNA polymerase sigma-70 factor (ECF subfamily)